MIRFMLDTNICIALIRNQSPALFQQFRQIPPDEVSISTITLAELEFGVSKSARVVHNATLLVKFCAPLAILPFGNAAAQTYGKVRAALEQIGSPIGPLDTLIASHALSLKTILVTENQREFRRVAGLSVKTWAQI